MAHPCTVDYTTAVAGSQPADRLGRDNELLGTQARAINVDLDEVQARRKASPIPIHGINPDRAVGGHDLEKRRADQAAGRIEDRDADLLS